MSPNPRRIADPNVDLGTQAHAQVAFCQAATKHMADASEGRFSFGEIYNYTNNGTYPDGFERRDKVALRGPNSKVEEENLFYIGGPGKYSL